MVGMITETVGLPCTPGGLVEPGHLARCDGAAAVSIEVGLLRASGGLLRPRLGVDGERGGFAPRSPVVERQRDMDARR